MMYLKQITSSTNSKQKCIKETLNAHKTKRNQLNTIEQGFFWNYVN